MALFTGTGLLIAGCQTRQREASFQERLESFTGRPLSEFILRTGRVPTVQTILSPTQKIFTFQGDTVTLVTPGSYGAPTVQNSQTCTAQVVASHGRNTATPADFTIQGISTNGPCLNL